jgi:hypothetical protein
VFLCRVNFYSRLIAIAIAIANIDNIDLIDTRIRFIK